MRKRKVKVRVYLEKEVADMLDEIVKLSRGGYPNRANVIVNLINRRDTVDDLLNEGRNEN